MNKFRWHVWPDGGDPEQATVVEAMRPEEAAEAWVSDYNDQVAEYPSERIVCVRGPRAILTFCVTLVPTPTYRAELAHGERHA